jgi:hypothetical protein
MEEEEVVFYVTIGGEEVEYDPTKQTSPSRTNRIYLSVLIQQTVVLLIYTKTKISRK